MKLFAFKENENNLSFKDSENNSKIIENFEEKLIDTSIHSNLSFKEKITDKIKNSFENSIKEDIQINKKNEKNIQKVNDPKNAKDDTQKVKYNF